MDDLVAAKKALGTVCVTGTNGKTSTTSMVDAIVFTAGEPVARVTTLGAFVQGEHIATEATAEAFVAAALGAVRAGVKTFCIETTSHALSDGFAADWPADVGVFTNLSRDHLDYHGTPETYLAAKAQLFLHARAVVLNAADPSSALLDEITPLGVSRLFYAGRAVDVGCAHFPLALQATSVVVSRAGTAITLADSTLARALGGSLTLRVIGEVHAENALAAACAAHLRGYAPEIIARGLAEFPGVPGRFQVVASDPLIIVDYAHTPDALERSLALARRLAGPGRVLVVFGCGGDRDPGKRPQMGAIAAAGADRVIITTDNPRSEDPELIASAVAAGAEGALQGGKAAVTRIPDREAAIFRMVEEAAPSDIVVIAGKGHETTQDLGDQVVPFDDAEVARTALVRFRRG